MVVALAGADSLKAPGKAPVAAPSVNSPSAKTAAPTPASITEEQANAAYRLRASQVATLAIPREVGQAFTIPVQLGDAHHTLNMWMDGSCRSPNYQVLAQVEGGELVPVEAAPINTMRGVLLDVPGSVAAGGMMDDGLHMMVRLPGGQRFGIEPLAGRVEGAGPDHYVVYRSEDALPQNGTCGVDDNFMAAQLALEATLGHEDGGDIGGGGMGQGGLAGGTSECAELGVDADFEYFQAYGSNTTSVENRINTVINTVNLQYESQVGIVHQITTIVIRTTAADPYTSSNSDVLLDQFRNEWMNNQGSIPRDVAHLFTGRNIDGSTIGVAFLGGVCNSLGYGLVQSDCCGGLNCAADLSAHELGHNWNATHCSCNETMNSGLLCANNFGAGSVGEITSFRDSRTCLSLCEFGTTTIPFTDTFPSTTIDAAKWTGISGAASNTTASGSSEPSAPNSLNLDGSSTGGDVVRSAIMNLTSYVGLTLSYWYERRGGGDSPESGDDLVVDYLNSSNDWVELSRQLGSGADMTTFQQVTVPLPDEARHENFRVRFRCISSQNGSDDWFVDNISITGILQQENDTCGGAAAIEQQGSYPFTTLGTQTDGPAEPSACVTSGYTQIDNDAWWIYVTDECGGEVTVSLCGADFNTKMAIYDLDGPCGSGTFLTCSDDSPGCGTSSVATFQAEPFFLYTIRIGGYQGQRGSGTMVITCVPPVQPCPADIFPESDPDGLVNIDDYTYVILNWGTNDPIADIDNNGIVDIDDYTTVVLDWGSCDE